MFLKKSIFYFMNIVYKHIFLNFSVISFTNKEMASFFQLHTYKFGLVYIKFEPNIPSGSRFMSIFTKRARPAKTMLREASSPFCIPVA